MDREKVVKGLNDIGGFIAGRIGIEQARNFLRTIDDAIELLREQEEYVPLEPVVMYLSHYASPPEMYPGIHTPEEERELWRKTLKSIK